MTIPFYKHTVCIKTVHKETEINDKTHPGLKTPASANELDFNVSFGKNKKSVLIKL